MSQKSKYRREENNNNNTAAVIKVIQTERIKTIDFNDVHRTIFLKLKRRR